MKQKPVSKISACRIILWERGLYTEYFTVKQDVLLRWEMKVTNSDISRARNSIIKAQNSGMCHTWPLLEQGAMKKAKLKPVELPSEPEFPHLTQEDLEKFNEFSKEFGGTYKILACIIALSKAP